MSALLDQLLAHASPLQATNRDAALQCGLPQARDERWRYSTLRALNERQFQVRAVDAGALTEPLQALIASSRAVAIPVKMALKSLSLPTKLKCWPKPCWLSLK